jgi:TetR/AcrR family transcriptional regulator
MFIFRSRMVEDTKLPRREREKARQRQEILAVALDLFSQKGYHQVSIHEIAQKSEFAIGTLYKFFKNKEDLYKTLMLELADKFKAALQEVLEAKGDEIEKLRSYVKVKGEVFRANISVIRLYFAEAQGASFNFRAGLDSKIHEVQKDVLKSLTAVFASGMKRNRFKRIAEPSLLAVALDGITRDFLLLWLESPERHPYPEDPDVILNIIFQGLVAS